MVSIAVDCSNKDMKEPLPKALAFRVGVEVGCSSSNLVDPASSHILASKVKPCMCVYNFLLDATANSSIIHLQILYTNANPHGYNRESWNQFMNQSRMLADGNAYQLLAYRDPF